MTAFRPASVLLLTVLLACGRVLTGMAADDAETAAVLLHARKADTLLERYAPSTLRDAEVRRELANLTSRLDRAVSPRPVPPLPGMSEEAYLSPIDGSAQPFHRFLPSAWTRGRAADGTPPALPLLVYLHGYFGSLDLINWAIFPPALTNIAEQLGACVACPFGRSNTDFQGIGEQDVLRVIDLMVSRYGVDPARVVLMGYSMGGMGTYTVGARFAERFNGLLVVCGRGDYATWQGLDLAMLPEWERNLIDAHFLSGQARRLAGMPVLAFHGEADPLVRLEEAQAAFGLLAPHNPTARLVTLPGADHWIIDEVLAREDCTQWLRGVLDTPRKDRPPPLGIRPGEVPSRLQNAFLDPFLFVQSTPNAPASNARFDAVCGDWFNFAKARPRHCREMELTEDLRRENNLFLFGEPEASLLIQRVLAGVDVGVEADAWVLQGRRMARAGHGVWLAVPSPFGRRRTVVVQCGEPWGAVLPPNHRYDLLPDVLVYTPEAGRIGLNRPVAAAHVGDDGRFRWYEVPAVE